MRFGASIEKSGQKKNNNSQKRIPRKSRIFTSVEVKLNNDDDDDDDDDDNDNDNDDDDDNNTLLKVQYPRS